MTDNNNEKKPFKRKYNETSFRSPYELRSK